VGSGSSRKLAFAHLDLDFEAAKPYFYFRYPVLKCLQIQEGAATLRSCSHLNYEEPHLFTPS